MARPTYASLRNKQDDIYTDDLLAILASAQNPDGTAWNLPISSAVEQAAREGRAFLSSTGRMTLSATGNVRATVQNPVGSGKRLFIYRLAGLATAVAWAHLYINPTAGLPSTARPVSNAFVGHATAPVGVLRSDQNALTALSGGTDSGIDIGIPNSNRWSIELSPFIVSPGITVGINIPFAGSADTVMTAYWIEEAI